MSSNFICDLCCLTRIIHNPDIQESCLYLGFGIYIYSWWSCSDSFLNVFNVTGHSISNLLHHRRTPKNILSYFRFSNIVFFMRWGHWPYAQPPTWRAVKRVSTATLFNVSAVRSFKMIAKSKSIELWVKTVARTSIHGLWNPGIGWFMHDWTQQSMQRMRRLEMCIITYLVI